MFLYLGTSGSWEFCSGPVFRLFFVSWEDLHFVFPDLFFLLSFFYIFFRVSEVQKQGWLGQQRVLFMAFRQWI